MIGVGLMGRRRRAATALWTPAALTGKLLWLRGDLGVTNSSGHVSAWADQSGNGNNLVAQGISSTQPTQMTWPAGLNAMAVYADGNDRLATISGVLPTADGAGYTIFFAGSFDDLTGRCAVFSSGTSGGVAISQAVGGDGKLEHWKVAVALSSDGAARTTALNVAIVDQVGVAPGSLMYVNGAAVTTTSPNGSVITPTGKLYVGAAATTLYHKGFIAELLVISGRASLATIALWNAYSLSRYGV